VIDLQNASAAQAADGARCPKCNRPIPNKSLVAACEACLNQAYLDELLRHEPDWVGDLSKLLIEVAPDLKKRLHIALFGDRKFAYCGARPIQADYRRKRMLLPLLPPHVCAACEKGLREAVATAQRRKGEEAK